LSEEGFPEDSPRSFSTTRRFGAVESEIEAESLDALLLGVRESTVAGDPDQIDDLELSVRDRYREDSQERNVRVRIDCAREHFNDGSVRVTVSGKDAGWVRGRAEGIHDLLAEVQAPRLSCRGAARRWYTLVGLMLSIVINNSVLAANASPSGAALFLFFIVVFTVPPGGFYLIGSALDRRYKTRLLFTPDVNQHKGLDRISLSILIVGIITLAVMVAQTLIAHSDAINPHH
jgi:hypothetical protein